MAQTMGKAIQISALHFCISFFFLKEMCPTENLMKRSIEKNDLIEFLILCPKCLVSVFSLQSILHHTVMEASSGLHSFVITITHFQVFLSTFPQSGKTRRWCGGMSERRMSSVRTKSGIPCVKRATNSHLNLKSSQSLFFHVSEQREPSLWFFATDWLHSRTFPSFFLSALILN